MKASKCRSCKASIYWGVTKSGANMPVDVKMVKEGTRFEMDESVNPPHLRTIKNADLDQPGHASHFATCPNANQHRRKKR